MGEFSKIEVRGGDQRLGHCNRVLQQFLNPKYHFSSHR